MLSKGDDALDRHNTVKKKVLPPKDNEADNKVDTFQLWYVLEITWTWTETKRKRIWNVIEINWRWTKTKNKGDKI